jgi:hypothetical protein
LTIGYQRQSVASIVNGNVINASDFNNEYNAILAAYDKITGHNHDGITVGGGAPILAVNGVSFPNGVAVVNTVPVVTSANTITYEAVPNAALVNSTVTIGSTAIALGATVTTIHGLTLTNGIFSGTITSPNISSPTITGTATLTGVTVNGGTFTSSTIASPAISSPTITGTVTLTGTTLNAGSFAGPTITSVNLTSGAIGSAVTAVTQFTGNNSTLISTTAFVQNTIASLSLGASSQHANSFFLQTANNLADVTASTARTNLGLGTAATHADTEYTQCFIGSGDRTALYTNGAGGALYWARNGFGVAQVWTAATLTDNSQLTNGSGYLVSSNLLTYAPLASPGFSGFPTTPTRAYGDNSINVASTAFVQTQDASTAPGQTYGSLRSQTLFESSTVFIPGTSYDGASVGQTGGQTWLCQGSIALGGGFTATLLYRTA